MDCQIALMGNTKGVASVAGAILLAAISIALAALVLVHGLDFANVNPPPELYFSFVEVKTNGWIYATGMGSGKIAAGDLKFIVNEQTIMPSSENFMIDGGPYNSTKNIIGGTKIALKAASSYASGQKIEVLVVHVPTGSLLCEATVEAKAE